MRLFADFQLRKCKLSFCICSDLIYKWNYVSSASAPVSTVPMHSTCVSFVASSFLDTSASGTSYLQSSGVRSYFIDFLNLKKKKLHYKYCNSNIYLVGIIFSRIYFLNLFWTVIVRHCHRGALNFRQLLIKMSSRIHSHMKSESFDNT